MEHILQWPHQVKDGAVGESVLMAVAAGPSLESEADERQSSRCGEGYFTALLCPLSISYSLHLLLPWSTPLGEHLFSSSFLGVVCG